MNRIDGRRADQLRPLSITTGYFPWAEGSVKIDLGDTQVLCACSVEDRVPNFLLASEARQIPGFRLSFWNI